MAINLPSLVSRLITPDLINHAAAAIGIDPALAQKLVSAAIPSVLGAFASEASSPDGAKSISDLISNQDPNMLDNLVAAVKGGDGSALAGGAGVLTSLLGSEGLNQLSSVLGKATGASESAAGSILGLVGPAVVGAISNQSPESWSDGTAVASLFEGEKRSIASALPASLAAALNDSGFLQGFETAVTGAAKSATSTLGSTSAPGAGTSTLGSTPTPSPTVRPSPAPPPPPQSSGSMTWLYLLIAIIVVGGVVWYIIHKRQEAAAPAPASSGQIETPATPRLLG